VRPVRIALLVMSALEKMRCALVCSILVVHGLHPLHRENPSILDVIVFLYFLSMVCAFWVEHCGDVVSEDIVRLLFDGKAQSECIAKFFGIRNG